MKKILSLYFILAFSALSSQNSFEAISSDVNLNNKEKNERFNSLLKRYTNENKIDSLLIETFEIIKWHGSIGNFEKAVELNKRNIKLMDSINYQDISFYRRNIYGLGFYESLNNETLNALITYKTLLKNNISDEYSIKGTFQIGKIYYSQGDYYKSLEFYELCRLISIELENDTYIAKSTLGIGKSNLLINTHKSIEEGIKVTSHTIKYLENKPDINVAEDYYLEIYKLLGNLYSDRHDYNFEIAVKNFNKALVIAKNIDNQEEISYINNDLGLVYLKDKRPGAENYFKKALEHRRGNVMYAVIHRNLAQYYLDNKKTFLALESIQKSTEALNLKRSDSLTELPKKERLKSSKFKNQMISSLIVKADVWLKLAEEKTNKIYYYEQAIKTIKLGDWLIDIARLSDIEYKSKLFWRKTATNLYITAVELYHKTNQPEEAFYYFEKNKAIQLLEDVNLRSVRSSVKVPSAISSKEKALKSKIIELEKLKIASATKKISRDLIIAKENYDNYINSLDPNIKLLYKLEQPAEVIKISTSKKNHLSSEEVYLEYILGNDSGYGLLISTNKSILFEITDVDDLKDLTINYRNQLNTPISDNEELNQFSKTSHKLYNILFPKNIRSAIDEKVITVIPDNYLQNIPFEPLLTSANDNTSYLLFQNEINYSYSITFLVKNRELVKENNDKIVGFAPISFKNNLPSLVNTNEELTALNKLKLSDIFLNENASKNKFYKISENAKIIHIASHANASDSISPWISFYDKKLHLNELYNHNTSADLVVLSACNTSLGELYKGEGVMSLARGFFHSGSQSVLTTLWTVNDKSTSYLMKDFYENLKSGETKSEALRNAKLNYLKSHTLSEASPYYWSSFILLGDTNKMDLETGFTILHYFIIGLILLIIIILYFRNKKK